MANTTLTYGALSTVLSSELNSLLPGGSAVSAEIAHDGSPLLAVTIEVAATASSTNPITVYLAAGAEAGKTSDTVSTNNMAFIGSVTLNGTTIVRTTFAPVINPPRFYRVVVRGAATATLAATGNTVILRGIGYTTV